MVQTAILDSVTAETSQTLDRGLRLLAMVADTPHGMSVAEASAALGVGRAVVYRLVTTLAAHGLVRRDEDGRIRLGTAVLRLARQAQPLVAATALPALRRLAEDVGATAHLTISDSGEALALAVVEPSWTTLHVAYRVGTRHALNRGAAGIAISEPDRPWVATTGSLQEGAHGVAAAVRGVAGLEASVGVVALGDLDDAAVGPRVVAAADEVARLLGD